MISLRVVIIIVGLIFLSTQLAPLWLVCFYATLSLSVGLSRYVEVHLKRSVFFRFVSLLFWQSWDDQPPCFVSLWAAISWGFVSWPRLQSSSLALDALVSARARPQCEPWSLCDSNGQWAYLFEELEPAILGGLQQRIHQSYWGWPLFDHIGCPIVFFCLAAFTASTIFYS